jgi:uncharacterized protein YegL
MPRARPREGGLSVVPFYIVCDEGSSMAGEAIESVNNGIVEIMESIADDPVVDSKARISIIAFNDSAHVLMDLRQTSEVIDLPKCVARGSSSYLSAFRALKERIEIDTLRLKTEGFHVLQPYVLFISCGRPNPGENWQDVRTALVGASFPYRPHILSFGVGNADSEVMLSLATTPRDMNKPMAFKWRDGLMVGSALREIMKFNVSTILISTESPQGGKVAVDMSQPPAGSEFIIDTT